MSKATLRKRYRALEYKGIIMGSTVQLDYPRLGYNVIGNIFFRAEPHQANEILQYIRKMPNIHCAWRTAKSTEINAVAVMETTERLETLKEQIRKFSSTYDLKTFIWIGIRNIRDNLSLISTDKIIGDHFLKENKEKRSLRHSEIEIDQIDQSIINKLSVNGRISFRCLAKQLSISNDTVARRYKAMKDSGLLKVVIQVNPGKIGYQGYATFYIAFGPESDVTSVVDNISKIPDIVLIVKTSGTFDLLVEAMVWDLDHLLTIQDKLVNLPGVRKSEMHADRSTPVFPVSREHISTF